MVAPVTVLQKQPGPVENQRFHGNILFRGQFFQLPPKFRRNVHLDIHRLNGIPDGDPPVTTPQRVPQAGRLRLSAPHTLAMRPGFGASQC